MSNIARRLLASKPSAAPITDDEGDLAERPAVSETPLSDEMAWRLWNDTARSFGSTIIRTLLALRAPVRFLYDAQFHADVIQYAETEYWSAVRRGKLPASTTGGWPIRVVARATNRLVWPRVRYDQRHVELKDQLATTCADDTPIDDARDRRLELEVLDEVLETFPELDRRLALKDDKDSDNDYKKIASDTGLSVGALRIRKHRAVKHLRREFNKRLLARRRW